MLIYAPTQLPLHVQAEASRAGYVYTEGEKVCACCCSCCHVQGCLRVCMHGLARFACELDAAAGCIAAQQTCRGWKVCEVERAARRVETPSARVLLHMLTLHVCCYSALQFFARLKAYKEESAALRADPEATLCDHRPLFLNLGACREQHAPCILCRTARLAAARRPCCGRRPQVRVSRVACVHCPYALLRLRADDNRRMELVPCRAPGQSDVNFRDLPGSVNNDDGARLPASQPAPWPVMDLAQCCPFHVRWPAVVVALLCRVLPTRLPARRPACCRPLLLRAQPCRHRERQEL